MQHIQNSDYSNIQHIHFPTTTKIKIKKMNVLRMLGMIQNLIYFCDDENMNNKQNINCLTYE